MWGVHLFDEASLNKERRTARTSRRRFYRRKQRVKLIQELFAKEIAKVDEYFFMRIQESNLYPEDTTNGSGLFVDDDFNDSDYSRLYPTIHHLIKELIKNPEAHDVRLVYSACAWLVAHRGHFLSEISEDNIAQTSDITNVYNDLMDYFPESKPWECDDLQAFGNILKKKIGVKQKYRELSLLLFGKPKAPNNINEADEFKYDTESILKLLCGEKVAMNKLFSNSEYAELDSITLDDPDEKLSIVLSALGDNAELIIRLKAIFDWALLCDILKDKEYISFAKVDVYEQHKTDLENLKYLIREYMPQYYKAIFRKQSDDKDDKKDKNVDDKNDKNVADNKKKNVNYENYINGSSAKQEAFCKYVKSIVSQIVPNDKDKPVFDEVMQRLDNSVLCPKQVNSDNRVIPYQVYYVELKAILDNAEKYLPFLTEISDGMSVSQKILSVFKFRIPYFVGPLNRASKFAWIERKADCKIYPWNFDQVVDTEASEQAFIDRMTNTCTYIPYASVLPKMSLCYEKFQMLNEINPINVGGVRISPEIKQHIFNELCLNRKRITKKSIIDFLKANNYYTDDELLAIGGIDSDIKSSMYSHMAFRKLLASQILNESDVEGIIERYTYTESKARFLQWLNSQYPTLSEDDKKYIASLKFKDFGRLSRELLCSVYGTEVNSETGEAKTILKRMWDENLTLMEVLSDKYTYRSQLDEINEEYYRVNKRSLDERLEEMYISNSVKRSIIRALDIVGDVVKANGKAPDKIFIEMARGGTPDEKGKRTKSRYKQLCELYDKLDGEDVRAIRQELDRLGASDESRLSSDKLFLYFLQRGQCAYTGEKIDLSRLSDKQYNIDHIYPRSKVKDDSVLNNMVLVLSTENGKKEDIYPLPLQIQSRMSSWWKDLNQHNFMTDEKYKRLTRREAFSETEKWGFINRQLVETRQSTKAIATILKERYPDSTIVYVKAGLVSEFRQVFDMLKSRSVNDLHHAKDAYLNIVVGNVYNERFTEQWFKKHQDEYNLKVEKLFTHNLTINGRMIWNGDHSIGKIKNIVHNKNTIHITKYATCQKGKLFNVNPDKAAKGLVPLKKGLPTEKYGGYNNTTASFFLLVKYTMNKKTDLLLLPVELMFADKVISDMDFANRYAKNFIEGLKNKPVQELSFPLGMRKIKMGTLFEFDNTIQMYITGKTNDQLRFSLFCPLIVGYNWERYVKRLERLAEKKKKNPNMIYSQEYDKVSIEENIALYDILLDKLLNKPYSKRPNIKVDVIRQGREKFAKLDIFKQTECLLTIVAIFGRSNNGFNLSSIGGAKQTAVITLSSTLSNWKKNYNNVRIVDISASGLFERKSVNILEL